MTIWVPSLQDDRPRYLAIVEAVERDLERGALAPGDQLPPQRDLALALEVSLGTVTRAYALAEERGLVRGEVGRGTFVGRTLAAQLPVSDTGQTHLGGINLGMTWPIDAENPDLAGTLRKLSRRSDLAELLTYQPNAGMPRHRRAGARWIASLGHDVDPDSVLVCAGAQHALTVVLSTLASAGDTILSEELVYPGVRAVADMLGLKLIGLPMDAEGLLPDAFDAACRKRRPKLLVCVPSIQNPTVRTQSAARREDLARIAQAHGVPIVEDAIHHRLLDPDTAPPLLASFAPELTYLIASPSKVVAGGLRVAFLSVPQGALDDLAHRLWATTWMVAPLAAEVMSIWIDDGSADAAVERKREEARARVRLLEQALVDSEGTLHTSPSAYHGWLELPEWWPEAPVFVAEALRRGVSVTAADAFYVGNGRPPAAVRVSVSAPTDRATLRTGLRRLVRTISSQPGRERPLV